MSSSNQPPGRPGKLSLPELAAMKRRGQKISVWRTPLVSRLCSSATRRP
jgi:hypothetical protein